jgi:regulator of replication initiation timing
MDVKKAIERIDVDLDTITDPTLKGLLNNLLNIVERQAKRINELSEENQKLRDENNCLKGEKGKPTFRKQTKGKEGENSSDISSEKERGGNRKPKGKKGSKKNKLTVNRVELCSLDVEQLPADACFKGYQSTIVQDIVIKTDNVEFKRPIYYSPSLKKTFIAPLPTGYQGEFGPTIKALILSLYHKSKVTASGIVDFLKEHGILIGASTVSRFLTEGHDVFHKEKQDIVSAGLQSAAYQQMDDTGARVFGKNYYSHILCNEFYTAYFSRRQKDRLTILEILTQGELTFRINDTTLSLMKEMHASEKTRGLISALRSEQAMNRKEIDALLLTLYPIPNTQHTNRQLILECSAISAYQSLPTAIKFLLTDDAPQYNKIAEYHPLCWVHDGRHYKKLSAFVPVHRKKLKFFLARYWEYYDKLLDYKSNPTLTAAKTFSEEFDQLFSTITGYDELDERIRKTKAKKDQLLLVLQYPFLPLHNNGSELGAREQARRRDISFHTMSELGTEVKDTFMTISQTARKLAVNFYQYVKDRVAGKNEMPALATLISLQSKNFTSSSL